jgi:hypothetical protein
MIAPFVQGMDNVKLIFKMKSAFTLTMMLFVAAALPALPQEHVDVPLPPYDPPPIVSHHRESHDDQSEQASQKAHSQRRTPQGDHRTKSHHADPHDPRIHRRNRHHGHFHWPWQHGK